MVTSRGNHRSLSNSTTTNHLLNTGKQLLPFLPLCSACDGSAIAVALLCVMLAGPHPVSLQRSVTDPSILPKRQRSMKLYRTTVPEEKTTRTHYFCLPLEKNLSCSAECIFDGNSNWAGTILAPAKWRNIWFQSLSAGLERPKDFQNS